MGRTPAVRPFIASWVVALSDHPLGTEAAIIIIRGQQQQQQRTQKTAFPLLLTQVKLTAISWA